MPLPIIAQPCACGCGRTTRTGQYVRGHNRTTVVEPGHKWCAWGKHAVPVEGFGSNRARKDGLQIYCRPCQRASKAPYKSSDSQYGRKHRARLRAEMFAAYGDVCACCGEAEKTFLCLDHINGCPDEHRRPGQRARRRQVLALLRREGWPPGYRVLCANCNHAFALLGHCPHHP